MTDKTLLIGIVEASVMHAQPDEFDLDTRFGMVKDAGVFDYFDKTPAPDLIWDYYKASKTHGLPLTAGGFYYFLNRDEKLLDWNLRIAGDLGSKVHNVQIISHDLKGQLVTNEQVAEAYLHAAEQGAASGVVPCFEVHVNMWSEHFGRVAEVARLVEAQGVKFCMTLDHSHVIFKIDNPQQQAVQGMDADIASGAIVLDPFSPGSICQSWIDAGYVRHMHARAAAPNGPPNLWDKHPNGEPGRGIQYPFIEPGPGEWHSPWAAENLAPWKEVVRQFLRRHATDVENPVATISTEFIPFTDYGGGARYSQFEHSIACARWIRAEWNSIYGAASGRGR